MSRKLFCHYFVNYLLYLFIHIIPIIISMNIKNVMIISKIDNNDTKLAFEFFS